MQTEMIKAVQWFMQHLGMTKLEACQQYIADMAWYAAPPLKVCLTVIPHG